MKTLKKWFLFRTERQGVKHHLLTVRRPLYKVERPRGLEYIPREFPLRSRRPLHRLERVVLLDSPLSCVKKAIHFQSTGLFFLSLEYVFDNVELVRFSLRLC